MMGSCFLKAPKVKIIDETPVEREFDYLRPNGSITLRY